MKTFIIAEAGVNHNGSVELAKKLIDFAMDAGADAVKFQTFKAENVISRVAQKAEYQKATTGGQESQLEMVKKLELSDNDHFLLLEYAKKKGIQFLSAPFDLPSIDFLASQMKLSRIKVPSGELTNAPYLLKISRTRLPLIVSTGMCSLREVQDALGVLAFGYLGLDESPTMKTFQKAFESASGKEQLKKFVSLLHCTTEYPAPLSDVNLKAMDTLSDAFGLPVGYSDHTEGIHVPIAAVARGATIIEKHFTLDRNMDGPDHKASLEPHELKEMVRAIRNVELCLGRSEKEASASEIKNKTIARKSLVAAQDIKRGDRFSEENLTVKRPGSGISPFLYWEYLGKTANTDIRKDELIP